MREQTQDSTAPPRAFELLHVADAIHPRPIGVLSTLDVARALAGFP